MLLYHTGEIFKQSYKWEERLFQLVWLGGNIIKASACTHPS